MLLSFIKNYLIDPEFNRKRKFLQRISLFQGISRREFGHLFQALVMRPYAPGEILFHEGDVGRALFILESGHVEISASTPEGGSRRIAVLNPGDYFGEMALLDDRPRMGTAAAMEPVKVHLLYKADLEKLIRNVPHIGAAIMTHLAVLLAARLRAMTGSAPISIASTVTVKEVVVNTPYGRYLLPTVALAATVYLLYSVNDILLPFILAAVQAFLFSPIIRFFEVRGLRRDTVVVLFYIVLMGMASFGGYRVVLIAAQEAAEASRQMPAYVAKGTEAFQRLQKMSHKPKSTAQKLVLHPALFDYVAIRGRQWPQQILDKMPSYASGILPVLEILFLVPFIGFFLMREGPAIRDSVLEWVPSRYVEMALNLMVEIDNSLGRYVRGICLEAACVGLLAYIGFWLIGLDYALQIALVVGLANIIPYVGPIVGGIIGSGVAIFQWGDPAGILKVFAVVTAVRFIEDWFIQPVVMRHAVHLHPVVIIFSLMAGAKLFGFWGLLFGVPIASMLKVLLQVLGSWYRVHYGLAMPPQLPEISRIPLI